MSKRGRDDLEEDEVGAAAMELGGILTRGIDVKLRALDRLRELIDPHDDLYTNQKTLTDADAAFYLTELLADDSEAVALRTAQIVAAMADHSAPAKARLSSGPLLGLESNVTKVMLNHVVQDDLIAAGAPGRLVPLLVSPAPQVAQAALEALTALSSYNHDGKMAYLTGLVDALAARTHPALLEALEGLIDGLDCSSGSRNTDEALSLVEKAAAHVTQALQLPGAEGDRAVSALGAVLEAAPALARDGSSALAGAPAALSRHLLFGQIQAQDAAARALRHLAVGDPGLVAPDGAIGPHAEGMARVLQALIARSVLEDLEEEEREGGRGSDGEGEGPASRYLGPDSGAAAEEVCFAEEAQELLEAIVKANPSLDVEPAEGRRSKSTCCIM